MEWGCKMILVGFIGGGESTQRRNLSHIQSLGGVRAYDNGRGKEQLSNFISI